MAFLNISALSSVAFQSPQALNEDVRAGGAVPRYHVFLSYRHQDRAYVPGVAKFLKQLQAGVYVDFLDKELNMAPSSQTAPILRRRISQSRKIIQIITPNSDGSRWMPWELGLGDGLLGFPNAVTLPVVNDYNTKVEQDYLNMYGYIQTSGTANPNGEKWGVFYPDGTALWFRDWLTK